MKPASKCVQSNQKLHYYHNIILLVCNTQNFYRKLSLSFNLNTDPPFLLCSAATLRTDFLDCSPELKLIYFLSASERPSTNSPFFTVVLTIFASLSKFWLSLKPLFCGLLLMLLLVPGVEPNSFKDSWMV